MNVVLLGDPESGKTSLVKAIAACCGGSVNGSEAKFSNYTIIDSTDRSAIRKASLAIIAVEQNQFCTSTIERWVEKAFLNSVSPGIIICVTKSTRTKPSCAYRLILTNSESGVGITELHKCLQATSNLLVPQVTTDVPIKTTWGSWFKWLRCFSF